MEELEKAEKAFDKFLQGFRKGKDSKVLWANFHEELLQIPRMASYTQLIVRIYDLFEARVSTENFINLVTFFAAESDIKLALVGFGANWYESRWIPAIVTSIVGGEEAINQLLGELRSLQNAAQEWEAERNGYWTLAYSKILVEAVTLIRPKNPEEKARIVRALKEITQMNVLPAAGLLAQAALDKRDQSKEGVHDASEHKIFLEYIEARTRPA